jgi:catechol 2,3-dioxygenase-like lactoylglutathione lyase family enzyme
MMNTHRLQHLGRREVLMLLFATAIRGQGFAQGREPLFPVDDVDHINIRVGNCEKSARFYHGLFGGDLLFIESIPPNPSTPSVESWFVRLGSQFLSITPTFPNLGLGEDLDHLCVSVNGFQNAAAAAEKVKSSGLETVAGSAGWIRDPDGFIYQLRSSTAGSKPGLPSPPLSQVKTKAGDLSSVPFAPVAIREVGLRVTDLNKTADFLNNTFGGEIRAAQSSDLRRFKFGACNLLLMRRATASPQVVMEHVAIGVRNFDARSALRILRERGVTKVDSGRERVQFTDPNGIQVLLVPSA